MCWPHCRCLQAVAMALQLQAPMHGTACWQPGRKLMAAARQLFRLGLRAIHALFPVLEILQEILKTLVRDFSHSWSGNMKWWQHPLVLLDDQVEPSLKLC